MNLIKIKQYFYNFINLLLIVNANLIFVFSKKYFDLVIYDYNFTISYSIILISIHLFIINTIFRYYNKKDFLFIITNLFVCQILISFFIYFAKLLPIDIHSPLSQTQFKNIFHINTIFYIPFVVLLINFIFYFFFNNIFSIEVSKKETIYNRPQKVLFILTGIFICIIFITNIITIKYINIFKMTVTCGIISYPFTFLITDIISEIFGEKESKQIIYKGLIANILFFIMIYVFKNLPETQNILYINKDLEIILTLTPGLVIASLIAYIIAQFCDVKLFAFIKKLTNDKFLWLRNNFATIISEVIDTLIFGIIAWVIWPKISTESDIKAIPTKIWLNISFIEYAFKCVFALFDTFLLYISIYYLKKIIKKNNNTKTKL